MSKNNDGLIDAMMTVPAPMLANAMTDLYYDFMEPLLKENGIKDIEGKKKEFFERIEAFKKGCMMDMVIVYRFDTREHGDTIAKNMEKGISYIGFPTSQFQWIYEYLKKTLPKDFLMTEWLKGF